MKRGNNQIFSLFKWDLGLCSPTDQESKAKIQIEIKENNSDLYVYKIPVPDFKGQPKTISELT